jgi:hypothetical protein
MSHNRCGESLFPRNRVQTISGTSCPRSDSPSFHGLDSHLGLEIVASGEQDSGAGLRRRLIRTLQIADQQAGPPACITERLSVPDSEFINGA